MMNFLFKTGTYLLFGRSLNSNHFNNYFSFLVWLIFRIYDDLIKIFELEDTSTFTLFVVS